MLGAAFFHMMPEAVRVGSPETLYWTAAGLLALFFLERFFSFHHHEAPRPASADASEPSRPDGHALAARSCRTASIASRRTRIIPFALTGAMRWGPAAIGLAVHSLVGGIALASAVAADFEVGRGALGAGSRRLRRDRSSTSRPMR